MDENEIRHHWPIPTLSIHIFIFSWVLSIVWFQAIFFSLDIRKTHKTKAISNNDQCASHSIRCCFPLALTRCFVVYIRFSLFFTFHFIKYSKSEKKNCDMNLSDHLFVMLALNASASLWLTSLCVVYVCVSVCGAECVSASTFVCVFMAIVCYRSNCVKRIKVEIHWRIYFIFYPVPWIICIGQCLVFHLALSTRHFSPALCTLFYCSLARSVVIIFSLSLLIFLLIWQCSHWHSQNL